jgi:integrase
VYATAKRAYLKWWKDTSRTGDPFPASTEDIKAFILHLARSGKAASTIDAYLAGLCAVHRQIGHNIERAPLYDLLKGVRRKAPPSRKAKPVFAEQITEVLGSLQPGKPVDVRNGALAAAMFSAGLRASEACALNLYRERGHRDDTAGYIERRPEGLLITLERSKTSQVAPQQITLAAEHWPATIEWLERWLALANVQPGEPVFRPVLKGGQILTTRLASASATSIVRGLMREHLLRAGMPEAEAYLAARTYSSHSLRRGFLSASAKAGTAEGLLRQRARHRTAETTAGYVEIETSWKTDWGIRL